MSTAHDIVSNYGLSWLQEGAPTHIKRLAPAEALLAGEDVTNAVVVIQTLPELSAQAIAPALLVLAANTEHAQIPAGWNVATTGNTRTTMAQISAQFRRAIDFAAAEPTLGAGVQLAANVATGQHVTIGARTKIGAHVSIGNNVSIGEDCVIYPNVVIDDDTEIGNRVVLYPGAVIGADGFGFAPGNTGALRIHHVGNVVLADDVEIGAHTCVDRGAFGPTRIGARTKIDNLCQIGHNVQIGSDCLIAGLAGIGGSTKIGRGVIVGGNVVFRDHIEVGDGASIGGNSALLKSVPAGEVWVGSPARPQAEFRTQMKLLGRLGEMWERVKGLPESEPNE